MLPKAISLLYWANLPAGIDKVTLTFKFLKFLTYFLHHSHLNLSAAVHQGSVSCSHYGCRTCYLSYISQEAVSIFIPGWFSSFYSVKVLVQQSWIKCLSYILLIIEIFDVTVLKRYSSKGSWAPGSEIEAWEPWVGGFWFSNLIKRNPAVLEVQKSVSHIKGLYDLCSHI